jgi:hypothetical protein
MAINEIIRLSISETARLFGLNAQTIRRAIKAKELPYIVVQGRYKIDFESALTWSQTQTTTQNKLAARGIGQFVDQWRVKNKKIAPVQDEMHKGLIPEPSPQQQLFTEKPTEKNQPQPPLRNSTSTPQQSLPL